jgi:hypothetical protein
VTGEQRYTWSSFVPLRPGKLRLKARRLLPPWMAHDRCRRRRRRWPDTVAPDARIGEALACHHLEDAMASSRRRMTRSGPPCGPPTPSDSPMSSRSCCARAHQHLLDGVPGLAHRTTRSGSPAGPPAARGRTGRPGSRRRTRRRGRPAAAASRHRVRAGGSTGASPRPRGRRWWSASARPPCWRWWRAGAGTATRGLAPRTRRSCRCRRAPSSGAAAPGSRPWPSPTATTLGEPYADHRRHGEEIRPAAERHRHVRGRLRRGPACRAAPHSGV